MIRRHDSKSIGSRRTTKPPAGFRRCGPKLILVAVVILVSLNLVSLGRYAKIGKETSSLYWKVNTGNYAWFNAINDIGKPLDWTQPGKYVLYTYPIEPPSNFLLHHGEEVICVYQPCQEFANKSNRTFFHVKLPEILLLAKSLSKSQSENFNKFIFDQHWHKIQHGPDFPHHLQSVTFLSLVASGGMRHVDFCIRHASEETYVCGNDTVSIESYDPTAKGGKSPYFMEDLNLAAKNRFGVLSFDGRVRVVKEANSGDELQTFPGLQFLPYLADFVDRDFGMHNTSANEIFANAWWGFASSFPPPSNTTAVFFSAHMSSAFQRIVVPKNIAFFRQYTAQVGPIGARDLPTLKFLKSLSLPSYQSSCFTQMLRPGGNTYPKSSVERDLIMLVDVNPDLLPADILQRGTIFTAVVNQSEMYDRQARLDHAQHLYELYSTRAKVVITSRIHSALPASVNGVPVIFVVQTEANLPGGRGGRTKGISDLFHVYAAKGDAKWSFNLDQMPPNPGVHRQDRFRASFWNYMARRLSPLYADTARFFGLIPLRRLGHDIPASTEDIHDVFHFVFTTPSETLTWRAQRAIEAVFYHHPNAKVTLHSQTLPPNGTRLDRFKETGYNFEIQSFDLKDLLGQSDSVTENDGASLVSLLHERKKTPFWYSHETDLIRLLLMERFGGVYLDTDVHLIKALPKRLRNILAYQDRLTTKRVLKLEWRRSVNGAVMIFEKDNLFLRELLTEAMDRVINKYDPDNWGILGPKLLTDVWRSHRNRKGPDNVDLHVLESRSFYPYNFGNAYQCFQDHEFYSPVQDDTYGVHLNTKVTADFQSTSKGSYCDRMFHTVCIFCDEVYTMPSTNAAIFWR